MQLAKRRRNSHQATSGAWRERLPHLQAPCLFPWRELCVCQTLNAFRSPSQEVCIVNEVAATSFGTCSTQGALHRARIDCQFKDRAVGEPPELPPPLAQTRLPPRCSALLQTFPSRCCPPIVLRGSRRGVPPGPSCPGRGAARRARRRRLEPTAQELTLTICKPQQAPPLLTDPFQSRMDKRIGFIGAGQMAEALARGFIAKGICKAAHIFATGAQRLPVHSAAGCETKQPRLAAQQRPAASAGACRRRQTGGDASRAV